MPQLDIQNREKDNPHRAGPENQIYQYGHLDVGRWFLKAALPSLPIPPEAGFEDLLHYFMLIYHRDYFHPALALGAAKGSVSYIF